MDKLQEIKQNYAKGQGFDSFEIMRQNQGIDNLDLNIICKEYAVICSQATLEKAYFNHEIFTRNGHDEEIFELNKQSITNPENIVLL